LRHLVTERAPASHAHLRLAPDRALVVVGSLSAKAQDRSLPRSAIRSVQVLTAQGISAAPYFDGMGELGVSSLVFLPGSQRLLCSTGADLIELDLGHRSRRCVDVEDLVDVHEMTVIGDRVWLANTGRDELVAVDLDGRVVDRRGLAQFRRAGQTRGGDDVEEVNRFHVNQVFEAVDGTLCCLVHHVGGRQLLRRVAARIVKSQGDGGILDVDGAGSHGLGLSGPHSARVVGSEQWVFDSGRSEVVVFDAGWARLATVPTVGWGRGAAVAADGSTVYGGMSPVRRRYRPFHSAPTVATPAVEAFDVAGRVSCGHVELDGIEQVNNLYEVDAAIADLLVGLA